ncbi:MAG: twin-arginine translocation pathway signal protein [Candidatus Heimdallarchaeota archaeon]|nr:twin-arginine translocation pathway signal protein [Candidatus Heimdallarchaeota archaeon]
MIDQKYWLQFAGPYFVDNSPLRSDITKNTKSGEAEPGFAIQLQIEVLRSKADACQPLTNAKMEIWHANASGDYSGIVSAGTDGHDFSRGHQITDSNGLVVFDTIFPGLYAGRTVHIHFKVITDEIDFTSQLYFNQSFSDEIFDSYYEQYGIPITLNANDGIYHETLEMEVFIQGQQYVANNTVTIKEIQIWWRKMRLKICGN